MILHEIRRPNSLKIIPSGVANCRNLPFGGRATQDSRVRLPRKENARSHHQRLFEENVGKTGKRIVFILFFARYVFTDQKSFKALDHLNDLSILLKGEKTLRHWTINDLLVF